MSKTLSTIARDRAAFRRPLAARGAVTASLLFALAALLAGAAPAEAGGAEPLTLRVSDAIAQPGGLAAVVLRTYSSRPVGQGQLDWSATCRLAAAAPSKGMSLRREAPLACLGGGSTPLAPYLVGHIVFSSNGDVQSTIVTPRDKPDSLQLRFVSPSGSVNDLDGPLAVLFLRLPEDVAAGTVIDLGLGAADTLLIDENGEPIPIEIRPGVLTVRADRDPVLAIADGDKVAAGETADLAVETLEPFPIAAGRIVLYYDPAFASGPPQVRFDSRYGRAAFTADLSTPGRIAVDFQSPDGLLNRIPGGFIQVRLPTEPSLPPGARSALTIDRRESWIEVHGIIGGLVEVDFRDAWLEIRD